ncbi:MAG: polyprenyl synthetase family protein [Treponema sp.]|nr:polyprenyl synthetase family protein [Treponema sp.]
MNQEYTQQLSKIEAELERWLPENPDSAWAEKVFTKTGKNADLDSMRFLIDPLRELVFRGGKRWRPLLMSIVCETLGGADAAVPLTPLVEFSHNASLIHDDIEDESDERRGKPSIHKLYGTDTAINSASFFYFLASCCIDNCAFDNKEQIYKLWLECMRRLHLGQAMDINWHRNISAVPGIEEYYLMCRMKTGSLARLSAELGALAAGAPPEAIQLLADATDKMGVGFQILDDIKNLTTGVPGKIRGDDVVEGKKGLPVLLHMHKYPEKRDKIFYCFHVAKQEGTRAPEVEELIDILSADGVFPEAEEKAMLFLEESRKIFKAREFAGFPVSENSHSLLEGFIKLIS